MSRSIVLVAVISTLTFSACSKAPDPAIQISLDELTRLDSATQVGINYAQYEERLLTTKGNIDVALQRSKDTAASATVNKVLNLYLNGREAWRMKADPVNGALDIQEYWTTAREAFQLAGQYSTADKPLRQKIDEKMQSLEDRLQAAEVAAQEEAIEAEKQRVAEAAKARRREKAERERRIQEEKRLTEQADREFEARMREEDKRIEELLRKPAKEP